MSPVSRRPETPVLSDGTADSTPVVDPEGVGSVDLAEAVKQAITTRPRQPEPDGHWIVRRGMSSLDTKDIR